MVPPPLPPLPLPTAHNYNSDALQSQAGTAVLWNNLKPKGDGAPSLAPLKGSFKGTTGFRFLYKLL